MTTRFSPKERDEEREEGLLEAVLAAPRDDEPRLVYADWLMERDDPRGELIVVQCTREACERMGKCSSKTYRAACARERELLAEHTKEWVDPVGLRNWHGEFSRGFIGKLSISSGGLRAKWETHFSRMPLASISLHERGRSRESIAARELSWLAAHPASSRLEAVIIDTLDGSVELDWQMLRPTLIELGQPEASSKTPSLAWQSGYALPIDPLCDAVRKLTLANATSDHIADLNLRVPSTIESLNVFGYSLDASDLALMLSTQELRNLRELCLGRLDDATATRAVESNPRMPSRFPNLKTLTLTGREPGLGIDVARALSGNRILQTIESLRTDVPLDEAFIRVLETKAVHLEHLVVDGPATDYAIDALARSPLILRLSTLSLVGKAGGTLGPPSVMPLMRVNYTRLSKLTLSNFLIGDGNAQAIKSAQGLRTLVELRLARCGLTDERARTIAASPYLDALTSVSFSENGLTPSLRADLCARWPEALIQL